MSRSMWIYKVSKPKETLEKLKTIQDVIELGYHYVLKDNMEENYQDLIQCSCETEIEIPYIDFDKLKADYQLVGNVKRIYCAEGNGFIDDNGKQIVISCELLERNYSIIRKKVAYIHALNELDYWEGNDVIHSYFQSKYYTIHNNSYTRISIDDILDLNNNYDQFITLPEIKEGEGLYYCELN